MKIDNIKKDVLPLVSIIIPTFNDATHLMDSVMGALNQTYKNIELIIIDNGSTDNTQSLISSLKSQTLQYYKTENIGAAAARNLGLIKANGQYVQYLDSDDVLEKDKIELQLTEMLKNKAQISFSLWQDLHVNEKVNNGFQFDKINYQQVKTGREMIRSFGMDNWFIPVFSWLTKRSLIEQAGPWDENLSNNDDGEFFFRVLFNAKIIVCNNGILGYYRRSDTVSLSNYDSEEKINSAFQSFKKIEDKIKSENRKELLCYPKRLYYIQHRMTKRQFPELAKRAARAFDSIDAPCFLIRKQRFWWCIQNFGLQRGIAIYNSCLRFIAIYRKLF